MSISQCTHTVSVVMNVFSSFWKSLYYFSEPGANWYPGQSKIHPSVNRLYIKEMTIWNKNFKFFLWPFPIQLNFELNINLGFTKTTFSVIHYWKSCFPPVFVSCSKKPVRGRFICIVAKNTIQDACLKRKIQGTFPKYAQKLKFT